MSDHATSTTPGAGGLDVIDLIAGLTPEESAQLRSHRPDVVSQAQASYDAIFPSSLAGDSVPGFSLAWRLFVATRATELEGHQQAHQHYLDRLLTVDPALAGALSQTDALPAAGQAVLLHTELLTRRPGQSDASGLVALQEAGLHEAEIVMLSQVVSFVAFQMRLAHGLNVLKETL